MLTLLTPTPSSNANPNQHGGVSDPETNIPAPINQNFNNMQSQHPAFQNHKTISACRKNKNLHSIPTRSQYSAHTQPKNNQHYRNRKFIHSSHTVTAFPTLGSISIQTTNVIYVTTCILCHKNYTGETQNSLHNRLSQHLFTIVGGQLGTYPTSHLIISGLENKDQDWIKELGTVIPRGLNEHPKKISPLSAMPPPLFFFVLGVSLFDFFMDCYCVRIYSTSFSTYFLAFFLIAVPLPHFYFSKETKSSFAQLFLFLYVQWRAWLSFFFP